MAFEQESHEIRDGLKGIANQYHMPLSHVYAAWVEYGHHTEEWLDEFQLWYDLKLMKSRGIKEPQETPNPY